MNNFFRVVTRFGGRNFSSNQSKNDTERIIETIKQQRNDHEWWLITSGISFAIGWIVGDKIGDYLIKKIQK